MMIRIGRGTTGGGPMRVGAGAFDPSAIAGLSLWLRASDRALNSISPETPATNGQTIRCWKSLDANAWQAEQATGTSQPLLLSSWKNGRPAITFDGVNDWLGFTGAPLPVASGSKFTLIWAAEYLSAGGGAFSQSPNDGLATNAVATVYRSAGSTTAYLGYTGGASASVSFGAETGAAVRALRCATTWQARRAGVQIAASAILSDAHPNSSNFEIGRWFAYCNMHMGELIAYNRDLTDDELSQVETYLSARYAL